MNARLAVTTATVIALSAAGCGRGGEPADGPVPDVETQILVENHNWADMTVYVERGGSRTRLGTVGTASSRSFSLPRALAGLAATIRLIADPVGGTEAYVSAPVQVNPGQRVNFSIAQHTPTSSIWISHR